MTRPPKRRAPVIRPHPVVESSRRLAASIPRFNFPSIPAIEMAKSLRPILELGERLQKQMEAIGQAFEPLRPRLAWWAKEDAKCKRLEKAGWLPHATSPEIEDESLGEDAVSSIVEAHYRENWHAVKGAFLNAVLEYEIDDEAKETFREALLAHEARLYRCSPRLLFPEIERVSCAEIHAGAMDKIASQATLREAIGGLTPAEMASAGVYGIRLYFKLSKHFYAHIKDTESLAQVLSDPTVPNRHATVHGYASYSSFQSSINALILTDFLLGAISTIKRLEQEDNRMADVA